MGKKTTTAPRRSAPSKMDLAALVSARVERVEIALIESVAKRGVRRDNPSLKAGITMNVHTEANIEERVVRVRPHFTLIAKYADADDDELLRMAATFLLEYSLSSFAGLKKPNFDAFGELNGVYNVWPYLREFVQSTTVRMGLPGLTIPVYRPMPGSASVSRSGPKGSRGTKGSKRTRKASAKR